MTVLAFQPKKEKAGCGVCGGVQRSPARYERDGSSLVECGDCGVWSVHPQPSIDFLQGVYGADYYAPWQEEKPARRRIWRRRLKLLGDARKGRLLDVGCAEGSFLAQARRLGFVVEGTEISAHGARETSRSLRVPVHHAELVEAKLPGGSFSVVTFWHVLEHMLDPGEALDEAWRLLEPDGLLAVAVPNRRNTLFRAAYRIARGRPPHLYQPDDREQHLHHWEPDSLRAALEIHRFQVLKLLPDPCAIGLGKSLVDLAARVHSRLAGEPRTGAMVALARPSGGGR